MQRILWSLALVAGLLGALVYATYLSYWGSENIKNAFAYQSAVVAAQRDSELLEVEQFEGKVRQADLRPYEKLLDSDLSRIDAIAASEAERAPHFGFPATRSQYEQLTDALNTRAVLGQERFDKTVDRNTRTRDLSNALFALVALLFVALQGRLRRRLEEGRSLVERLQRAFISKRREVSQLDVGSVLISATRGSYVGGDVHDVFTLDGRHAMFLVADVSGKGIDAAVDTALIKYSIRTLFSEHHDPGEILSKFGVIYAYTAENPETFVVLFVGVIDLMDGTVKYASAGHEPAWACVGGGDVIVLETSGPIVGIDSDAQYETRTLQLAPGEAVVVSTDGLTEARDARGRMLGAEGVRTWLGEISGNAQTIADAIVRRLRKRSRRISDDLAILVVRYEPSLRASAEPASAPAEPALVGGDATN